MALQHLRSSTADKRPTPGVMSDGQLAMNTNLVSPGLFLKDSNGDLVKVGPVHVGTTAPNVTPGAGGQAGNSKGEQWLDTSSSRYVFKIWDGTAWRSEDGEFVNVSGDTMTGALVMDNQQQVRFRETTANGVNFIAIQAPASVAADRTLTLPDVTGTIVSTGDTGSVTSTMILDGTILNADINASAAIVDTKLATIATAGKVSNSATTAASANTASAIVARDASGNFTAGTITAALTGAASSNVLKAGDTMTGALVHPLGAAATPSLTFTGDLNTGIYSPGADQVAVATNGTGRLFVDSAGDVGVGISVPTAQLHVANVGTNDSFIVEDSGSDTTPFRIAAGGEVFTGSRLVVGAQETYGDGTSVVGITQLNGAGNNNSRIFSHIHWGGNPRFRHCATPSVTVGTHTISALGGGLGAHDFFGSDGVSFIASAAIASTVDATPSVGVVPGNLTFSTAPAGTLTERLRITSAGLVGIGTSTPTTNIEVVGVATTDTEVNYALLRGPGSTQPGIYFGGNSTTASTGATARYGYIRSESLGGTARALYLQTGTNTRVVIDNTGQVGIGTTSPTTALQVVGTVTATTFAGALTGTASGNARLVQGTAVSTTSGTSIDFTSIPSWVKRITVTLAQVSTNGASIPLIQLGDSGGVETTGYFSLGASISTGTDNTTRGGSSTDGIRLASNVHTAGTELSGNIEIINISGNTWIASGVFIGALDDNADITIARKTLSATLDRIRLTTTGGTNTFDLGGVNILYEG